MSLVLIKSNDASPTLPEEDSPRLRAQGWRGELDPQESHSGGAAGDPGALAGTGSGLHMSEIRVLGFPGEKLSIWRLLRLGSQPAGSRQTSPPVHKPVLVSCGPLAMCFYICFQKCFIRVNRKILHLHKISYHSLWNVSIPCSGGDGLK